MSSNLLYLERTGTSLHFWVGPFGLHLWRHASPYVPGRINFDHCKDWR